MNGVRETSVRLSGKILSFRKTTKAEGNDFSFILYFIELRVHFYYRVRA